MILQCLVLLSGGICRTRIVHAGAGGGSGRTPTRAFVQRGERAQRAGSAAVSTVAVPASGDATVTVFSAGAMTCISGGGR